MTNMYTNIYNSQPSFEPKTQNRFIVSILNNKSNTEIIPSYTIKSSSRPSFSINIFNKPKFNNLILSCYDPIQPNLSQLILQSLHILKNCKINIKLLSPTATVIEKWSILYAKLLSVSYKQLDWSNSGDPLTFLLTFNIKNVSLIHPIPPSEPSSILPILQTFNK